MNIHIYDFLIPEFYFFLLSPSALFFFFILPHLETPNTCGFLIAQMSTRAYLGMHISAPKQDHCIYCW